MALFWCPFGRASRIEYVYSHRAPAFVAFTAIIIMLFLPPHKLERVLALITEYQVVLYSICAVMFVGSWTLQVRRGHDLGYNWFSTLFRSSECMMFKGWQFNRRLFKEEGSPLPNEYGPAPEENR